MVKINAVSTFRPKKGAGVHGKARWRLTPTVENLYEQVMQ